MECYHPFQWALLPATYHALPTLSTNPYQGPGVFYFSEAVQVNISDSKLDIHIYYIPPQTTDGSPGLVMVCHHGVDFASLSFALFAKEGVII